MSRADTLLSSQTFRTPSAVPMMTVSRRQSTRARERDGSFHRPYFLDEVSHRALTSGVYCSISVSGGD